MRALLLLLVLSPAAALAGSATFPIINGEPVTSEDFPSTLQIILDGEVSAFGLTAVQPVCTGTLIYPDVVLTAGHCTEDFALTFGLAEADRLDFWISFDADHSWMMDPELGGNAPLPDGAVAVSGFTPHPDWDFEALNGGGEVAGLGHFNDIALMFLEEPVTAVPFTYLPTADEGALVVEQLEVDIVGYGQRSQGSGNPFEPPDDVGERYWAHTFVNEVGQWEFQVGDGPETGRKCHGDSGGPTYADIGEVGPTSRVIGVTSRAYDDRDCEVGGVDIRVDAYLAWIDEAMRAACDDGLRTDCAEPGIPSPDPAAGDDDDDDDDAGDDDDGGAGCRGCASAGRAAPGAGLLLLVLGLRRRRA